METHNFTIDIKVNLTFIFARIYAAQVLVPQVIAYFWPHQDSKVNVMEVLVPEHRKESGQFQ